MFGLFDQAFDMWGGQTLAEQTAPFGERGTVTFKFKERKGRRYLVLRFTGGEYYLMETDQADVLIAALKEFREKL